MEIQEIKQGLSIETVLKYYGLQANRNPARLDITKLAISWIGFVIRSLLVVDF